MKTTIELIVWGTKRGKQTFFSSEGIYAKDADIAHTLEDVRGLVNIFNLKQVFYSLEFTNDYKVYTIYKTIYDSSNSNGYLAISLFVPTELYVKNGIELILTKLVAKYEKDYIQNYRIIDTNEDRADFINFMNREIGKPEPLGFGFQRPNLSSDSDYAVVRYKKSDLELFFKNPFIQGEKGFSGYKEFFFLEEGNTEIGTVKYVKPIYPVPQGLPKIVQFQIKGSDDKSIVNPDRVSIVCGQREISYRHNVRDRSLLVVEVPREEKELKISVEKEGYEPKTYSCKINQGDLSQPIPIELPLILNFELFLFSDEKKTIPESDVKVTVVEGPLKNSYEITNSQGRIVIKNFKKEEKYVLKTNKTGFNEATITLKNERTLFRKERVKKTPVKKSSKTTVPSTTLNQSFANKGIADNVVSPSHMNAQKMNVVIVELWEKKGGKNSKIKQFRGEVEITIINSNEQKKSITPNLTQGAFSLGQLGRYDKIKHIIESPNYFPSGSKGGGELVDFLDNDLDSGNKIYKIFLTKKKSKGFTFPSLNLSPTAKIALFAAAFVAIFGILAYFVVNYLNAPDTEALLSEKTTLVTNIQTCLNHANLQFKSNDDNLIKLKEKIEELDEEDKYSGKLTSLKERNDKAKIDFSSVKGYWTKKKDALENSNTLTRETINAISQEFKEGQNAIVQYMNIEFTVLPEIKELLIEINNRIKIKNKEKVAADKETERKETERKEKALEEEKKLKTKLEKLSQSMCHGQLNEVNWCIKEAKRLKMSKKVKDKFGIIHDLINTHFHTTYYDDKKDLADNTMAQNKAKERLIKLKEAYYHSLSDEQKRWLDINVPK